MNTKTTNPPKAKRAHTHVFKRSKPSATVETCTCGKFRFTENAGGPIVAQDKTAHTPGPWQDTDRNDHPKAMDAYVKIDAERQGIAYVYGDTKAEREANARLIAAAPDLLEAARFSESVLRACRGELQPERDAAIHGLQNAIAKAEGRS